MGPESPFSGPGTPPSEEVAFETPTTPEAEPRADLVAKYSTFRDAVHPKADVIYHPCGSNDISPSEAFPGSRVIYADIDAGAMEAVLAKGLEAHTASALEFDPGDVDILIMLNPGISAEVPASHVAPGGYVLCNDYHGTATTLHADEGFELKGMVRPDKEHGLMYDTENPEAHWEEIESEEEFRQSPFSWTTAGYGFASKVVENVTGKTENILAEYKAIVTQARQAQAETHRKMIEEHPELAESLEGLGKETTLMFTHNGRQMVLNTEIPRKKGTSDDIFVFQKTPVEN